MSRSSATAHGHYRYDTQALTHYWGFKWLDATGCNSFWIGLMYFLFVVATLDAIETSQQLVRVQPELKWVVATISAGFLTLWIVLARGAQKDYRAIRAYAHGNLPTAAEIFVQSSRTLRILEWCSGSLLGYLISISGRAITQDQSPWDAIGAPFAEYHLGFSVGFYSTFITLVFMIAGISMMRLLAFLYRQIRHFSRTANSLHLDLLNPEPLAAFADQSLRTFLGVVALAATIPLTLSASAQVSRTLIPIGLPMMIVLLVLLFLVSIPLWTIRRRLKAAKNRELHLIAQALAGDRSALSDTQIAGHQDEFQMPELLYYQDRVKGIWEWPLHAHIRRIALYVILPPLAWVLAAVVELFVDTALQ